MYVATAAGEFAGYVVNDATFGAFGSLGERRGTFASLPSACAALESPPTPELPLDASASMPAVLAGLRVGDADASNQAAQAALQHEGLTL